MNDNLPIMNDNLPIIYHKLTIILQLGDLTIKQRALL
jgi:hypothetical protein